MNITSQGDKNGKKQQCLAHFVSYKDTKHVARYCILYNYIYHYRYMSIIKDTKKDTYGTTIYYYYLMLRGRRDGSRTAPAT
jgi:hypothetical protein